MKDSNALRSDSATSGPQRTQRDTRRASRPAELVSIATAASQLEVSVKTVRRLIDRGELPVVRLTKRTVRIPAVEIDALVKARTAGGQSA